MRAIEEQRLALDCLQLAHGDVALAERYYAFVTGKDVDDAKRKLDAVQKAVSDC